MSGPRKLIENVQAMAPQRIEASDRTGAVRVVLRSDGDWSEGLRERFDALGAMVEKLRHRFSAH
jgi:hypothetical protein